MKFSNDDKRFMEHALALAESAAQQQEVPVGALLVYDNTILAEGFNQPVCQHDPTAHAEIVTLRKAGLHKKNYRLTGTTLYVTLEPCIMCAGAMIHARIERVVFGAFDPKSGACGTTINIFEQKVNHHVIHQGGLLENRSAKILRRFFASKR